jgi:hypothetical protein
MLRPIIPTLPFEVPNSVRLIDPTKAEGDLLTAPPIEFADIFGDPTMDPTEGNLTNRFVNFGWEYVYHCHILSHEEMDMMHAMNIAVAPTAPSALNVTLNAGVSHDLSWTDNSTTETGFTIEWAPTATGPWGYLTTVGAAAGTGTTVNYTDMFSGARYYRVAAGNLPGAIVDAGTMLSTGLPKTNFPMVTANSDFTAPGGP